MPTHAIHYFRSTGMQLKLKMFSVLLKIFFRSHFNYLKIIINFNRNVKVIVIFWLQGTGKTSTLIEIILQVLKNVNDSKILVATQSYAAANILASRLIKGNPHWIWAIIFVITSFLCHCIRSDMLKMMVAVAAMMVPMDAKWNVYTIAMQTVTLKTHFL